MSGSRFIVDSNATFDTTNDGLRGCYVTIVAGTGAGQSRRIIDNSATRLNLESIWTTNPSTDSVYHVGAIDFQAKSAEFDSTLWGYPAGATLNWTHMLIECEEQAETYSTGRVILTKDSTAVTGQGTTFASTHRGMNIFIRGYADKEHFISAYNSATSLTLTAAWTGQTGNYPYKIGAKLLKVNFYINGSDTAYRTVYGDMASSPMKLPISCKSKTFQYELINNRVDEPVQIDAITIKQPTLYV